MNIISSRTTAITKWVIPAAWCAGLLFVLANCAFDGAIMANPWFILASIAVLAFSLALFRAYMWDLMDSVADHGTYLVARRGGVEARIALDNIMNVNTSTVANVNRITLRLVQPTALGSELAFIPETTFKLKPYAKNAVAESLIERAFASRSKRPV